MRRDERPTSNIEHPTSNEKQKKMKQRAEGEKAKRQRSVFDGLQFHSTFDIIAAVQRGLLPDKIMLNTHPQRWTNNPVEWTKELVWQNVKNVVKRIIVRRGKLISE